MPLKRSTGNMYDWVTHMHAHLEGACIHDCAYCYVSHSRFGRLPKNTGHLRLNEKEFSTNYGADKTIFIEHTNDLFANNVPDPWIVRILDHCKAYPKNTYIFQTKNPWRALPFFNAQAFPSMHLIGTTIETNRHLPSLSLAPSPLERYGGILKLSESGARTFITIEPIMDMVPEILGTWIANVKPEFINIGADSKNIRLPEPDKAKIYTLINLIAKEGIVIRGKTNLKRLINLEAERNHEKRKKTT